MNYGIDALIFDEYASARTLAGLASEAEEAGWDGFFIWDHMLLDRRERIPVADPWMALAAMAMATKRIRLGPTITPLARRRPWKLAREAVTLDHLSGGRVALGVGLGFPPEVDFETFGEDPDNRVRARKLDEGLDLLKGFWSGEPFSYSGQHYRIKEAIFLPKPLQTPRIPIWVACTLPHRAPLRRAARWDGVYPISLSAGGTPDILSPEDVREVRDHIARHRVSDAPFDVVIAGMTPGDDRARAADIVGPRVDAGITWWMEYINPWRGTMEEMRTRIRQGPPSV